MNFAETGVQQLKVVAIYGTKDPLGPYAISIKAFDANVADARRQRGVGHQRAGRLDERRPATRSTAC